MGWVAASEDNWIPTQKSVGTDFYQSKDFSDDSSAGNRYVVVFLSTSTYVEELRGLLAGKYGERIPAHWLHRGLGVLILWGGIRYLC